MQNIITTTMTVPRSPPRERRERLLESVWCGRFLMSNHFFLSQPASVASQIAWLDNRTQLVHAQGSCR